MISKEDFKKIKVGEYIQIVDFHEKVSRSRRFDQLQIGKLIKVLNVDQLTSEPLKNAQVYCEDNHFYFRDYIKFSVNEEESPEYFL